MVRSKDIDVPSLIRNYKYNLKVLDYCYSRLDSFTKNLNNIDIKNKNLELELLRRSFKKSLDSVFILVDDYMGYLLDIGLLTNKGSTGEASFSICLSQAYQAGVISPVFSKLIKSNINFRNDFSHNYGEPSIEDYVLFYRTNRNKLNLLIDDLDKFLNTRIKNVVSDINVYDCNIRTSDVWSK